MKARRGLGCLLTLMLVGYAGALFAGDHYGYHEDDPTKQYWKDKQSVWIDDFVVARRSIEPMRK